MLLIEFVIVILFFSLCQVILVQVFAGAQSKTMDTQRLNDTMLVGQDIAERVAAAGGDMEAALAEIGFQTRDESQGGPPLQYVYDMGHETLLIAQVQRQSQIAGELTVGELVSVSLCAVHGDTELFTWPSVRYIPAEVRHEQ